MTNSTKSKQPSPSDLPKIALTRLLANVFSFGSRTDVKSKHKTFLNIFLKGLYFILFLSLVGCQGNQSGCESPSVCVGLFVGLLWTCFVFLVGVFVGLVAGCTK